MKLFVPFSAIATLSASSAAFVIPDAFSMKGSKTVAFSTPPSNNYAYSPAVTSKDKSKVLGPGPGEMAPPSTEAEKQRGKDIWDATLEALPVTHLQGGALRTWSYPSTEMDRVFISLNTDGPPEGNPLKVKIDLNQGPDNTPQIVNVYSGKGRLRPFNCIIETPGEGGAVFIRNLSPVEFPSNAKVLPLMADDDDPDTTIFAAEKSMYDMDEEMLLQGQAVRTYDLPSSISSCKVELRTDGRPLNAQVELIQGPNAPKYIIDIYTEDGEIRPFTVIMETPGAGNSVRIINKGAMEFPMLAACGPSTFSTKKG
mmetsp:Transcript_1898/g.2732  ORF Transcript_1898/g.2732 Transcript_1898/m.2732 type:complete len:312 (+) Transcript_1898:89-1024(+)|eukprot:CAMPEP_0184863932 /NCGR_PEP_ID=MMETSP0580-20130426/13027_1 /TAXON_ID=1118495 /ORGANISM="Dactyliosolen fragilissimus" /LENGTH=311 /DNA_ID=CAMNT_0027362523 /DNA_START=46 /DNA_END=981 /DNA_ORIENTATION=+